MNYIYINQDIKGSTTGSLKKGIVTKRNVNPLRPKYNYLGAIEVKEMRHNIKNLEKQEQIHLLEEKEQIS